MKSLDFLFDLKNIKENMKVLEEKERELSTPILTDLSLIDEFYDLYRNEVLKGKMRVYDRCKFIYVILVLYSPISLVGCSTLKGVRGKLASVFNLKESVISDNIANVVFLYNTYKDFKEDVNYLYNVILKSLM